ncbi:uncharacterized protein [Watersipora subatra]|uniref:uncharacterized protein n=1 Tax=Watersipora subatra TaxID=2589382 RepID=UPI00355C89C2
MVDVNAQLVSEFYSPNFDRHVVFNSLDANNDYRISAHEFIQHRSYYDINYDDVFSKAEFVSYLVNQGSNLKPALYIFDFLDANSDGNLNSSELAWPFAKGDQNGRGNIPKAEFVAFWSQHTGLDMLVSTQLFSALDGDKNGISSAGERLAAFGQFDSDSSFNVTRSFYETDKNEDNVLTTDDSEILFQASDIDGDNMTSAEEFVAAYNNSGLHSTGARYLFYRLFGSTFDSTLNQEAFDSLIIELDSNGDGQVTLQEFIAEWADILAELAEASLTSSRTVLLFNKYDTDKTGNLSFEEFNNIFNMTDTNEDGLVSRDEFKENWMRATLESADGTEFLFQIFVDDYDDVFGTYQEIQSLFGVMDYGDDDLVSYDEFQNYLLNVSIKA